MEDITKKTFWSLFLLDTLCSGKTLTKWHRMCAVTYNSGMIGHDDVFLREGESRLSAIDRELLLHQCLITSHCLCRCNINISVNASIISHSYTCIALCNLPCFCQHPIRWAFTSQAFTRWRHRSEVELIW